MGIKNNKNEDNKTNKKKQKPSILDKSPKDFINTKKISNNNNHRSSLINKQKNSKNNLPSNLYRNNTNYHNIFPNRVTLYLYHDDPLEKNMDIIEKYRDPSKGLCVVWLYKDENETKNDRIFDLNLNDDLETNHDLEKEYEIDSIDNNDNSKGLKENYINQNDSICPNDKSSNQILNSVEITANRKTEEINKDLNSNAKNDIIEKTKENNINNEKTIEYSNQKPNTTNDRVSKKELKINNGKKEESKIIPVNPIIPVFLGGLELLKPSTNFFFGDKKKKENIKTNRQNERPNMKPRNKDKVIVKAKKGMNFLNKVVENKKVINTLQFLELGIEVYSMIKEGNEINSNNKLKIDLESINQKNMNILLYRKNNELKEKEKKEKNKKIDEENQRKKCKDEWNNKKNKLIDSILSEINYLDLIEDKFRKYVQDFKTEIDKNILTILNDELRNKSINQEEHHLIFISIKNNILEIETLNFMIVGATGVGKSCLTNALLQFNEAVESEHIKPQTTKFKQYKNPNKIPGITIYDTIGIEHFNQQNQLSEIKDLIKNIFKENLNKKDSLHGILYCRRVHDVRIEEGEIEYIKELNNLYGNSDILTIVFTQSLDEEENETMEELRKELNNNGIDIIKVNSKKIIKKIFGKQFEIPEFGIDKLFNSMMKNAKKIISANLKHSVKIRIKEKYIENNKQKYNEMVKKFKNHEFGNICTKEFELILRDFLIIQKIKDIKINFNFRELEKVILNYIQIINTTTIIKQLKKIYEEKSMDKINDAFINLNAKYDNILTYDNWKEQYNFYQKFEEYLEPKINEDIYKFVVEKASLIFLEKCKEFFSEIISDNVTDEEIEDLVNTSVNKILKKMNKL